MEKENNSASKLTSSTKFDDIFENFNSFRAQIKKQSDGKYSGFKSGGGNGEVRIFPRRNSRGMPETHPEPEMPRYSNVEIFSFKEKAKNGTPFRMPKTENTPPRKAHGREISISSSKQGSSFKKNLESRIKEISRSNRKGDSLKSLNNSLYESPSKKKFEKPVYSAYKGTAARNVFDEITENMYFCPLIKVSLWEKDLRLSGIFLHLPLLLS